MHRKVTKLGRKGRLGAPGRVRGEAWFVCGGFKMRSAPSLRRGLRCDERRAGSTADEFGDFQLHLEWATARPT